MSRYPAMRMRGLAWALGVAAIGTQISYPLTAGAARDAVSIAVVALLGAACAVHAAGVRGLRWTAGMLTVTAGGGLLVEMLGTASGLPFGSYSYASGRLGPTLGTVPLIIGLAWTAGAYPAWCAADRVARGRVRGRRCTQLMLGTAGLVGWDLYLDPQMVADGQWSWTGRFPSLPGLPQVPVSNYLGWLLIAVLMMAALDSLGRYAPAVQARGHGAADALPLTLYLWTWLGSGLAHAVFLGLTASAVYGFVAMGVLGTGVLASLGSSGSGPHTARRAAAASSGKRPAQPGTMGECKLR